MSIEQANSYQIHYYAGAELRVSDNHPGPLHKAEMQAINGMIKHLFSGVTLARIVDANGQDVHSLALATAASE